MNPSGILVKPGVVGKQLAVCLQELLAVPGLHTLLDALVPYTQRHFSRADRLLRSTYLVDYVLGAMNVLSPEEEDPVVSHLDLARPWGGCMDS